MNRKMSFQENFKPRIGSKNRIHNHHQQSTNDLLRKTQNLLPSQSQSALSNEMKTDKLESSF